MTVFRIMFFIHAVLFSGCVIPKYFPGIALTDSIRNEKKVNIDNILIVGAGSTASRLFLENLSTEMIKRFKKNKLSCSFNYVGKIPAASHLKVESFIEPGFETYFIFSPIDTSFVNKMKEKYVAFMPIPGIGSAVGTNYGNQYKQKFLLELYTNVEGLQLIWKAELILDFDVSLSKSFNLFLISIFISL